MKHILPSRFCQLTGSIASAIAVLLTSSPVFAGSAPEGKAGSSVTPVAPTQSARDARATQLIGKDVRNAKGEDLGDIQDLVIDMDTGRVHYAVLSFGGVMGLGDKWFAYPLKVFRPAADKDDLILNVDQAQLKNAEGFEKNRWPNWNDVEYRTRVDRAVDKQATVTKSGRFKRVKEIIGGDVKDAGGKDIGDIKELVVNLGDGSVRYAVIEFDRGWFKSDRYVALPMQSLKRTGDRDEFVVTRTQAELQNAPSFDKDKWPDINDPKYRTSVERYSGAGR